METEGKRSEKRLIGLGPAWMGYGMSEQEADLRGGDGACREVGGWNGPAEQVAADGAAEHLLGLVAHQRQRPSVHLQAWPGPEGLHRRAGRRQASARMLNLPVGGKTRRPGLSGAF